VGAAPWKPILAPVLAPTWTCHDRLPAWRFSPPSATFTIRYPAGKVPLAGSLVTLAAKVYRHVPGVPEPLELVPIRIEGTDFPVLPLPD